jgi:hypothetical protein
MLWVHHLAYDMGINSGHEKFCLSIRVDKWHDSGNRSIRLDGHEGNAKRKQLQYGRDRNKTNRIQIRLVYRIRLVATRLLLSHEVYYPKQSSRGVTRGIQN